MMRLFRRASKISNIPTYDKLESSRDQNDKLTSEGSDTVIKAQVTGGVEQNKNRELNDKNEYKNSTYTKTNLDQREGQMEVKMLGSVESAPNAPMDLSSSETRNHSIKTTLNENTHNKKYSPVNNNITHLNQDDLKQGDPLDKKTRDERRYEEIMLTNGSTYKQVASAKKTEYSIVSNGHTERVRLSSSESDQSLPSKSVDQTNTNDQVDNSLHSYNRVDHSAVTSDNRASNINEGRSHNVHQKWNVDKRRYSRKSDASSDSQSRSSSSSFDSHGSYSRSERTKVVNHLDMSGGNMVIDNVNKSTESELNVTLDNHVKSDNDVGVKQSMGYINSSHSQESNHVNSRSSMSGEASSKYYSSYGTSNQSSKNTSSSASYSGDVNYSSIYINEQKKYYQNTANIHKYVQNANVKYEVNTNGHKYDPSTVANHKYEGSRVKVDEKSGDAQMSARTSKSGIAMNEMNREEMESHSANKYNKYEKNDQKLGRNYVEGYDHKMGDQKVNYVNYKQEKGKISPQKKKMKSEYMQNMYQYGVNNHQAYIMPYMAYPNMNYTNYVNVNQYNAKHTEYQPHGTERHHLQGGIHTNTQQYKQSARGGIDHKYYRDQYYPSPANRNMDHYVSYPNYANIHYSTLVDASAYKNYKMNMQKANMYTHTVKQIKPRQSSALQILNPETGEVVNATKSTTATDATKAAVTDITAETKPSVVTTSTADVATDATGPVTTGNISDSANSADIPVEGSLEVGGSNLDASDTTVNEIINDEEDVVNEDVSIADKVTAVNDADTKFVKNNLHNTDLIITDLNNEKNIVSTTSESKVTANITDTDLFHVTPTQALGTVIDATNTSVTNINTETTVNDTANTGVGDTNSANVDIPSSTVGDTTCITAINSTISTNNDTTDINTSSNTIIDTDTNKTTELTYDTTIDVTTISKPEALTNSVDDVSDNKTSLNEGILTNNVDSTSGVVTSDNTDKDIEKLNEHDPSKINLNKSSNENVKINLINEHEEKELGSVMKEQVNKNHYFKEFTPLKENGYKEINMYGYKKMDEMLSPMNILKYNQMKQSQLVVNNMSQLPNLRISKTRLKIVNKPINPSENIYTLTELHPYKEMFTPKEHSKSQQRKIQNVPLKDTVVKEVKLEKNVVNESGLKEEEESTIIKMTTNTDLIDIVIKKSDSESENYNQEIVEKMKDKEVEKADEVSVKENEVVSIEKVQKTKENESDRLPQAQNYIFEASVTVKTESKIKGEASESSETENEALKSDYVQSAESNEEDSETETIASRVVSDVNTDTVISDKSVKSVVNINHQSRLKLIVNEEKNGQDQLRFSTHRMICMGQELKRKGLENNKTIGTFKLVPLNYTIESGVNNVSQSSFQSHSTFSDAYVNNNNKRKQKKETKWRSELSIEKEELTSNKMKKPGLTKKEQFKRSVRTLLNKLTVENFLKVSEKITALYKEASDQESVKVMVDLLHEKATLELEYSDMYADLAFLLKYSFNDTLDMNCKTTSFHKTLLNKCQDAFENISTNHSLEKNIILGNIRFMGELFLRKILSITILKRISCTLMTSKCTDKTNCMVDSASSAGTSTVRTTSVPSEEVTLNGVEKSTSASTSEEGGHSVSSEGTKPVVDNATSDTDNKTRYTTNDTSNTDVTDTSNSVGDTTCITAINSTTSTNNDTTDINTSSDTIIDTDTNKTTELTYDTTIDVTTISKPEALTSNVNSEKSIPESVENTPTNAVNKVSAESGSATATGVASSSRSSNSSEFMEFRPPANLIECFSELLTTIGYTVDQIPGGSDMLDEYLAILISLKKSGIYPTRINFKIQDLIDLRKRNWRKKLFKEKATSVSQIHRQAEQEQLRGGPQEGRFVTAGLQTNRHYTPILLKRRQLVIDSLVNGVYTEQSSKKVKEGSASDGDNECDFHSQIIKLFSMSPGRETFEKEWRSYRPSEDNVSGVFNQMLRSTMSAKSLDLCLSRADIVSLTLAKLVDSENLRARLLNMFCDFYLVNLQEEIKDNPWTMDVTSKILTLLFYDFVGESRNLLEKIPIPKHFQTAKQLVINIVNGTREMGGDLGFTRRVIRRHLYSTFHHENLLFLDEI